MPRKVKLEKRCSQRTNDETLKSQINFIIGRSLGGSRGAGWECRASKVAAEQLPNEWVFTIDLNFNKISGRDSAEAKQWQEIVKFLVMSCAHSKFGQYSWKVVEGIEQAIEAIEKDEDKIETGGKAIPEVKSVKDYGVIATDKKDYFDHIFNRKAQIDIIHSAIVAAVESDFNCRYHCVLYGPPGCGKSEILLSVGKMLGKENDAYLKFDATSTTEAGAAQILLQSDYIPPVLIAEEIEKTDEKSLRWLLGIMDHRAEIRRTNCRIGNRARNVKMLVLATVNDMALFRRVMFGALASRFCHEIFCPVPSREVMKLILEREVKKANGKSEWIEPTLKFCCDEMQITDPRKVIPICLCGRDALLNGSYQASILATRDPKKEK